MFHRICRVRSSRAISKGLEGSKLDLNFNIFKLRNTSKICYMFSGVKYRVHLNTRKDEKTNTKEELHFQNFL